MQELLQLYVLPWLQEQLYLLCSMAAIWLQEQLYLLQLWLQEWLQLLLARLAAVASGEYTPLALRHGGPPLQY